LHEKRRGHQAQEKRREEKTSREEGKEEISIREMISVWFGTVVGGFD